MNDPSIEELLLLLRRSLFDQLLARANGASTIDYIPPGVVSELGRMLLAMGVKIVRLKVGHRGLYLCTAGIASLAQMADGS